MKHRLGLGRITLHVLLAFVCLTLLFPFYWMLLASVSTGKQVLRFPPNLIPPSIHFENYVQVISNSSFARNLLNSAAAALSQVLLGMVVSVLAAFALSHFSFRLKRAVLVYLSVLILIPFEATFIFNYRIAVQLRLNETLGAIVFPFLADAFSVIALYTAFCSAPRELYEAAQLDGACNAVYIFRVLCPMYKPILTLLSLLIIKSSWNAFTWPMLINKTAAVRTLPIGIYSYISETSSRFELVSAYSVLSTLPVLLLYLIFSRQMVWSSMFSGEGYIKL